MAKQTVDEFLAILVHSRRAEVESVMAIIAAAEPTLTQQVKWNAPSFCHEGDDRITLRLQPGDRVDLVFHRGAKKKPLGGFSFRDPSGLLRMVATDRGVVEFANAREIERRAGDLKSLVSAWIAATANQV
jgi:hypothetical protein